MNRSKMCRPRLRRQTKLRRLSLSKVNHRTRPPQTRSQARRRFGIKSLPLEKRWSPRRRQQNQLNQRRRRKIPSNPRRSNQVSRPCAAKRNRSRRIEHPEASEAIALCLTKTITTENQFTRGRHHARVIGRTPDGRLVVRLSSGRAVTLPRLSDDDIYAPRPRHRAYNGTIGR